MKITSIIRNEYNRSDEIVVLDEHGISWSSPSLDADEANRLLARLRREEVGARCYRGVYDPT